MAYRGFNQESAFGPTAPEAQGYQGVNGGNPNFGSAFNPKAASQGPSSAAQTPTFAPQQPKQRVPAVFGVQPNGQLAPFQGFAGPVNNTAGGGGGGYTQDGGISTPQGTPEEAGPQIEDPIKGRIGKPIPGIPGYHYGADGWTAVADGAADPSSPSTPNTPSQPTTTQPGRNQYGGTANLDPNFIREQMRNDFLRLVGREPTEAEYANGIHYATKPDVYSDGKTRVGWNGYLAHRLAFNVDSADPRLAGDEGVLQNYTGGFEQGISGGSGGNALAGGMYGENFTPVGPSFDAMSFLQPYLGNGQQAPTPTSSSVYTPGMTGVNPGAFSPYGNPEIEKQLSALSATMLQNAQKGIDPNMLKEQQKEAALRMFEDQSGVSAASGAARGTGMGGYTAGMDRDLRDSLQSRILDAYRTIDLQTPGANQQLQLGALQGANGLINDATTRQQGNYTTGLQGQALALQSQQALENARQYAAQHGLNYDQLLLATHSANENVRQNDRGFGLNAAQLGMNQSQFGQNHALNQHQLLSNILQGNLGYGLNLAQFQAGQQNGVLGQILSLLQGLG